MAQIIIDFEPTGDVSVTDAIELIGKNLRQIAPTFADQIVNVSGVRDTPLEQRKALLERADALGLSVNIETGEWVIYTGLVVREDVDLGGVITVDDAVISASDVHTTHNVV